MSRAVSQDSMRGVWHRATDERCTVEPSTDSFYRSHEEQLQKPVHTSRGERPFTSQTVAAQVVQPGFTRIHKGVFCFCVLPPHVDERRMI